MQSILKSACLIMSCCFLPGQLKARNADSSFKVQNKSWRIEISKNSGGITRISNAMDTSKMNFVHDGFTWGILYFNNQPTIPFDKPLSVRQLDGHTVQSLYGTADLKLKVIRRIQENGEFTETYTLFNSGTRNLVLLNGDIGLVTPFNDSYVAGAPGCLSHNCNAHLWAGGVSSWVNAERMNRVGPHLGLALTNGSFSSYSILDGCTSNDRGKIAFNLSPILLKPGEYYSLSWKLFWQQSWADFWVKALAHTQLVKLTANHYTVTQGENIYITATAGHRLNHAVLTLNGRRIPFKYNGKILTATVKTLHSGEQVFELNTDKQKSLLKANVIADPLALVKARVGFIIDKQQRIAPGSVLDGAYLCWENDEEKQLVGEGFHADWNEARERVGMGVLLALYLPYCKDAGLKAKIIRSLDRFQNFIAREIQDSTGTVYNSAHFDNSSRSYNNPWIGHFHLAMYQATGKKKYLQLFTKTVKAYYGANKGLGIKAYPIGVQLMDGLNALKDAGMDTEYNQVRECFINHANSIAAIGSNYPKSEVNYEQSIVAPGVQIELEAYLFTKEPKYLNSARQQMVYLECFNGQQPDYHLNDLGIRHWDDFWFGKLGLYGDTFPHYWSTISAVAFDEFAKATGDQRYRQRASDILMNNMCQFTPDGRASCAYVYPLTASGGKGQRFDPRANDQDWALVNWLTVSRRNNRIIL